MANISVGKQLRARLLLDSQQLHYALLGLVILLGAALRIYQLGAKSYWVDELNMLQLLMANPGQIITDFRENGRPPVFVSLAYGWVRLFGTSEAGARSLGVLISLAALGMQYVVGRQLFDRPVGLISTLIMALAYQQIYQAQNFRYYSLMVLLTLVSFFYYLRVLRRGGAGAFAGWTIASVLLFYTHYFAVFTLAAQSVHFLIFAARRRRLWIQWLGAQLIIYAPVALQLIWPLFRATVVRGGPAPGPDWIPPAELRHIYDALREFLLSRVPLRQAFVVGALFVGLSVAALTWVRGFATTRALLRDTGADLRARAERRSEIALTALWLLFPLLIPFALSLVLRPMYITHYLLGASPALYLLIALGLASVRRSLPAFIPLGFLVVLILPGLQWYYASPGSEQWREAAAYVTAASRPGDVVLVAPDDFDYNDAWDWYYHGPAIPCARNQPLPGPERVLEVLEGCAQKSARVWLVLRTTSTDAPITLPVAALLDASGRPKMRVIDAQMYSGVQLYLVAARP